MPAVPYAGRERRPTSFACPSGSPGMAVIRLVDRSKAHRYILGQIFAQTVPPAAQETSPRRFVRCIVQSTRTTDAVYGTRHATEHLAAWEGGQIHRG
jgi:hypothetical protein